MVQILRQHKKLLMALELLKALQMMEVKQTVWTKLVRRGRWGRGGNLIVTLVVVRRDIQNQVWPVQRRPAMSHNLAVLIYRVICTKKGSHSFPKVTAINASARMDDLEDVQRWDVLKNFPVWTRMGKTAKQGRSGWRIVKIATVMEMECFLAIQPTRPVSYRQNPPPTLILVLQNLQVQLK